MQEGLRRRPRWHSAWAGEEVGAGCRVEGDRLEMNKSGELEKINACSGYRLTLPWSRLSYTLPLSPFPDTHSPHRLVPSPSPTRPDPRRSLLVAPSAPFSYRYAAL